MTARDEWGPWIEHDATPCPLPIGTRCEITCRFRSGREETKHGIISSKAKACPSWVMLDHRGPWNQVIRYRIRRPRALLDLIDLVENLPSPTPKRVPA